MTSSDIEKIFESYRGLSTDTRSILPANLNVAQQAHPKLQVRSTIGIAEPSVAAGSSAGIRSFGTAGIPAGEMEESIPKGEISIEKLIEIIDNIHDRSLNNNSDQIHSAVSHALNLLKKAIS